MPLLRYLLMLRDMMPLPPAAADGAMLTPYYATLILPLPCAPLSPLFAVAAATLRYTLLLLARYYADSRHDADTLMIWRHRCRRRQMLSRCRYTPADYYIAYASGSFLLLIYVTYAMRIRYAHISCFEAADKITFDAYAAEFAMPRDAAVIYATPMILMPLLCAIRYAAYARRRFSHTRAAIRASYTPLPLIFLRRFAYFRYVCRRVTHAHVHARHAVHVVTPHTLPHMLLDIFTPPCRLRRRAMLAMMLACFFLISMPP